MSNWRAATHRRPTWRRKDQHEGFCVRDVTVHKLNAKWAEVNVPKMGPLRFRLSRPLPEEFGMARVTMDRAGRWQVSFAAPQPAVQRGSTGAMVGIDRGVATTMATSDGRMFRVPRSARLVARAERLRAQMSRQKKGSARRRRTKAALAKVHARIADRRRDWVEKTTTRLVKDYDLIVLEDLRTKDMLKRPQAKPDPEHEGAFLPNGARAKAGLNKAIHTACWGMLLERLQQKALASGVQVVLVDPRFTSQECHACNHVARENRESQAVFRCVACGHRNHADINAALNILARGLASLALTPGQGACRPSAGARRRPHRAAGRTPQQVAA